MKNKVVMQMVGLDGNAFSILGRFNAAAKKAGWTPEEIKEVHDDATSGDYSHLLCVISDNVTEPDEDEDNEDEGEKQVRCFNCREEWCAYDICDCCENCPDCCEC